MFYFLAFCMQLLKKIQNVSFMVSVGLLEVIVTSRNLESTLHVSYFMR
jgi:hypothetical protein